MFPHVVDGGLYVCEDLHTSFRHEGRSAIDYFASLIRPVLSRKHVTEMPMPRELWQDVARVSFILRTVLLEKRIGGPKVLPT